MQMRVVRIITRRSGECNSFSPTYQDTPRGNRSTARTWPVLRSVGTREFSLGESMRTRTTALSAAISIGLGMIATVNGQSSDTAAADTYTAPRTSWGHPDLQGVWDYRTITPLERRPEFGDREFYTDEEIAQLEGRATRRMEGPPDPNAPANLVHAEYLTDPGRRVDESRRTSLIIDPPTG